MGGQKENNDGDTRLPVWIRILWVAVGLVGAALHTGAHQVGGWPDADLVTIAWIVFAALGLLLPNIDSIDFPGGGGVKFHKALQAGAEGIADLERALNEATDQVQDWLSTVEWLNLRLQRRDVDDDAVVAIVFRFCLERMEDAKDWMGDEDEPIRISLWWYDEIDDYLFLMFSNDIRDDKTMAFRFKPGQGLMGQAFIENRLYNLDDAPSSAFYVQIRESTPDYRGLLLVPVRVGDEALGVISIDRQQKRAFSDDAENIAEGLASLIGFALMHPRVRTIMTATPTRVNDLLLSWRAESEQPALEAKPALSSEDSESEQ